MKFRSFRDLRFESALVFDIPLVPALRWKILVWCLSLWIKPVNQRCSRIRSIKELRKYEANLHAGLTHIWHKLLGNWRFQYFKFSSEPQLRLTSPNFTWHVCLVSDKTDFLIGFVINGLGQKHLTQEFSNHTGDLHQVTKAPDHFEASGNSIRLIVACFHPTEVLHAM